MQYNLSQNQLSGNMQSGVDNHIVVSSLLNPDREVEVHKTSLVEFVFPKMEHPRCNWRFLIKTNTNRLLAMF
jgi:hypothetical protein